MPDAFDPYFKWLGIPKADQPPHCYRLLGIEMFESDVDVISNAVDARMAQLKSFQSGQHAADSQRLLNEIAAAKIWLLNPQKKSTYDSKLRAAVERRKQAATGQVRVAEPLNDGPSVAADANSSPYTEFDFQSTRSSAHRVAGKKQKLPIWVIPSAGVALASIAGLGPQRRSPATTNKQPSGETTPSNRLRAYRSQLQTPPPLRRRVRRILRLIPKIRRRLPKLQIIGSLKNNRWLCLNRRNRTNHRTGA